MTRPDGITAVVSFISHFLKRRQARMTTGNINYHAVLADLEAKKAELEAAIATIQNLVAGSGNAGGSGGVISPDNIPVGAFLRLSIADATKKFLDMVKTKQSVPQIIKALESGGLPPVKYTTLYTVLRRRESQIGDVLRIGDEWALTEWYPNNPNLKRNSAKASNGKGKKKTTKGKSQKRPTTVSASKEPAVKIGKPAPVRAKEPTATVQDIVATHIMGPSESLDAKVIVARLKADFGKNMSEGLLKSLLARDSKKRFQNVHDNTWSLKEQAEK